MVSGISAILNTISLLGILMLLAGVALVVVNSSQGRSPRGGVILAVFGLVIFGLFQIVSRGVFVVQPTQRAVVFRTLSGELTEPRGPGTHVIIPVFEQAILYPVNVDQYTMSGITAEGDVAGNDAVEARSRDGQVVLLDITVLYRVSNNASEINTLHQRWYDTARARPNYRDGFIRPTVRALARDATSRYNASGIYGEQRTALNDEMEQLIAAEFQQEGLILEDLLLRNVTFSDQFTAAIEQAQVAEQETLRAEIRVRQVQQEAQQNVARAQGERDAAIERARGAAAATILEAQAQAEALRIVSEQIAANPALIQYTYVQNLSDNIGLALVPSDSPFLFDFASLGEAMPDFVAPETGLNTDDLLNPETETDPEALGLDEVLPEVEATPQPGN